MIHYKQFFSIFSTRRPNGIDPAGPASPGEEIEFYDQPAETFPATLDEVSAFRAFMPTAAAGLSDR